MTNEAIINDKIINAATDYINARQERSVARTLRNKTIAAMTVGITRTTRGFCEFSDTDTPPCFYATDICIDDWCDTCKAQEPHYQAMCNAGKKCGVALRKLVRLIKQKQKATP